METKTTTTQVFAEIKIEGLHRWANCPIPEVDYLKNLHRHIFHIRAIINVTHDDRDVEFIEFSHQIREFLNSRFYSTKHQALLFDNLSCEHIANVIMSTFPKITQCLVSEDGENGAIVSKEAA